MTVTFVHGRFRLKLPVGIKFALRMLKRGKDERTSELISACGGEIARELKAYKKRCGGFVLFEAIGGDTRIIVKV